ncbi:alpha/beta hydrolase family protein [Photobacterium sp. TY1-4]|uniref:alpha/beta hydrolase family protein n=1 Tax=Photobacterium sp. TY1-4 TaxID=2899122 RepID=UPI0021C0A872|nr:hypothetical protein [Photobacterium sp. TY1-4]UXH99910.1 hypothetical protein NH461_08670 [Photobacterium sp. TY1-4]
MKKVISFLGMLMLSFSANAVDGTETGLQVKRIYSPDRQRDVEIYYWYPTNARGDAEAFGQSKVFLSTDVIRDAEIAPGQYPVVLLSHGGMRSAFVHTGWIAAALVKQGYFVVVPKPPGFDALQPQSAPHELVRRPSDISLALSSLKQHPALDQYVDHRRVFGAGFFLGGTAMMTLAGAKISPDAYKTSCEQEGVNIDCQWLSTNRVDFTAIRDELITGTTTDPRIKAYVVINPELTQTFDEQSLKAISVPVTVLDLSGSENAALAPAKSLSEIPQLKLSRVSAATPYSAFSRCSEIGLQILTAEGADDMCIEPGAVTRAAHHRKIIAEMIEVFK